MSDPLASGSTPAPASEPVPSVPSVPVTPAGSDHSPPMAKPSPAVTQSLITWTDVRVALLVVAVSLLTTYAMSIRSGLASWREPFITICLNWLVVMVGVGDQIRRNAKSNRAAEQLSWNVFLSNIAENMAWALLSWAIREPIILIARGPGLLLDQVVFWQMLFSTKEAKARGKAYVWGKYALMPVVATVLVVAVVPIWFAPHVQTEGSVAALKIAVLLTWLWTTIGWVEQIVKNNLSGKLTGRDFSLKIPLLVELYLASWLFYEFRQGRTGWLMYATMGTSLAINTFLLIQSLRYAWAWNKSERERTKAAG
jgi:hypothetical protein